jgi:hypothetical protein
LHSINSTLDAAFESKNELYFTFKKVKSNQSYKICMIDSY